MCGNKMGIMLGSHCHVTNCDKNCAILCSSSITRKNGSVIVKSPSIHHNFVFSFFFVFIKACKYLFIDGRLQIKIDVTFDNVTSLIILDKT